VETKKKTKGVQERGKSTCTFKIYVDKEVILVEKTVDTQLKVGI